MAKSAKALMFEGLYEKYAPGLIFYARNFVDHQTAEDMVHNVFLKIWRSETLMIVDESIGAYLSSAVRNACLDMLKHKTICNDYLSNAVRELKMEELASDDNIVENLINRERIDAIYQEIEKLPEKCREIFVMAYIDEKKNVEIAEQLHISIRTVEAQIYKALKIIRAALKIIILAVIMNS